MSGVEADELLVRSDCESVALENASSGGLQDDLLDLGRQWVDEGAGGWGFFSDFEEVRNSVA